MRARRRQRRSGTAVLELTLSMMVLGPMFLGAATFGYSFYLYEKLVNAVRTGARYASTLTYDSATSTPTSAFSTAVKKMTVYGDPAANTASATAVVAGLTTSNVNLTVTFASGVPTGMTVSISGYQIPSYPGRVTLSNKPYAWFPFTGLFGPP
jgi:Flp pilus assembly protein TadG